MTKPRKTNVSVKCVKTNRNSKRSRRGGRGSADAPVSSALALTTHATSKIRITGTDRIAHIANIAGMEEGTVVLDVPITCSDVPRLETMGKAYQRVIFDKLVFRVVPMSSTANSGGYVAAFVPDVRDVLGSGPNTLNRLVAQDGAKIAKIWQSTNVAHKCVRDLLYTSIPPKGELRLSSPGRFVIALESTIPAKGDTIPISVYMDWSVLLCEPSLEVDSPMNSPLTAHASFYLRSANMGLWWADTAGADNPTTKIPGIKKGVNYVLPSKRFVDFSGGGDENAPETLGSFDKVRFENDKVHGLTLWVLDYNGKPIKEKPGKNVWFIEEGDTLTPEPENVKRVLSCPCPDRLMQQRSMLPGPSLMPLERSDSQSSIETIPSTRELMTLMRELKVQSQKGQAI